MKYFFTIVLVILFSTIKAQVFVSADNTWTTNEGSFNPQDGSWAGSVYMYKFIDSFELNGMKYMELSRAIEPDFDVFEPVGSYRQDGDMVFKYYASTNVESLIYDFGLVEGDTTTLNYQESYVEKIDSVLLEDGSYRKRMELKIEGVPSSSLLVIEGIGAPRNLFSPTPYQTPDASWAMNCYFENDVHLYSLIQDGCSQFTSGSNEIEKNEYNLVYENGLIRVDGPTDKNLRLKLFALSGQLLQNSQVNQYVAEVNTDFKPGIVICHLSKKDLLLHTQLMYLH